MRRAVRRHAGQPAGGHREAPGALEIYQGRQFKVYRGMGSPRRWRRAARIATSGGCEEARSEGVEGRVAYKGR
ncbi:MAG: IMP dehydrogenase [Christensenellales bacterium]